MADTSVQVDVALWLCESFLPKHFGSSFSRDRVRLSSGGDHSFAAVSADRQCVGTICSGAAATVSGKLAVGKLNKVRADLYFLLLAECEHKFLVAIQPIMYELLKAEQTQYNRIPADIEILHADLPANLAQRLSAAQRLASAEVSPLN